MDAQLKAKERERGRKYNLVFVKNCPTSANHLRLPDFRHFALMSGRDPEKLSNDELLALLAQHPEMMHLPGTVYEYSNTNYDLLAKIVETVAKANSLLGLDQTFIDFVREWVFKPHGMCARCSADPTCQLTIDGYNEKRKLCVTQATQTREFGSTGVVGPPSDMVHWNKALARGELDPLLALPASQDKSLDLRKRIYCRGLSIRDIDEYRRIAHGGQLDGYITIFRRYAHLSDSRKTFAFFLATNIGLDVKEVEKIADEVANVLAETQIELGESTGTAEEILPERDREEEARSFEGRYSCVGFGTQWKVEAIEAKPRIWEVYLSPADTSVPGSLSEPIPFSPRIGLNGAVLFKLPGVGRLERTEEGFDCIGEKMPCVHFKRID